jgi:hypothetical protein
MKVVFRKTGEQRYSVTVVVPGQPPQTIDPAPFYDESIPHDLVHYTVEAVAGMSSGVFGRAARGGGTFVTREADGLRGRDLARARRKQRRRETSLARTDDQGEMATSERLAGICDLTFRRRAGQSPDLTRAAPSTTLSREDARTVAQVVARLEVLAPLWRALPAGAALAFTWPEVVPCAVCSEMDRWHSQSDAPPPRRS